MSSTTATLARCTSCRELRDPVDLLLVSIEGRPSYSVCRPLSYIRSGYGGGTPCFRVTGPASSERIEVLADYLAREPTP